MTYTTITNGDGIDADVVMANFSYIQDEINTNTTQINTNTTAINTNFAKSMQLVSTQTLESNASTINFTSLDINTAGYYKIILTSKNGDDSAQRRFGIQLSGDTTDSHYNSIRIITSTSATTREYDADKCYLSSNMTAGTNFIAEILISQTLDTKPLVQAVVSEEENVVQSRVRLTNSTANVTAILLTFNGAKFGAGTIASLYKIPK